MESEINQRTANKEKNSIEELILVKWKGTEISPEDSGRISSFTNMQSLSILNSGLKSLANFPILPNLRKLELSDNKLCKSLEPLLNSPELVKLSLAGNQIKDPSSLEPLKLLPNLQSLDLLGNPITEIPDYSKIVFGMFQNLKILDGLNAQGDDDSLFSGFDDSESESSGDLSDFIENDEDQGVKRPESEPTEMPEKKEPSNDQNN